MTTVDPIASLVTFFTNDVSYTDDSSNTQSVSNNGLQVAAYNSISRKNVSVPFIQVGPYSVPVVKPQNPSQTPNARNQYQYLVEVHVFTQNTPSPNVSGYDAMVSLVENIRSQIVKHASNIDGSGNFYYTHVLRGPNPGPDTEVTTGRYEVVFLVELWRSVVD